METSICVRFNKKGLHESWWTNGKIYEENWTPKWGSWTFEVISEEIVVGKVNLHVWTLV